MILALLAASAGFVAASTTFPGGRFDLPAGCTAPPKIETQIDVFLGKIACAGSTVEIFVFGGAGWPQPCPKGPATGKAVELRSLSGARIVWCKLPNRSGRQEMLVDLGVAALTAQVRSIEDVFLVLRVAAGFSTRPSE